MEKKWKVNYLPLFYEDLDKIITYIANDLKNEVAAKNLLTEIEEEINRRAYHPDYYEKYQTIKNRKYSYYRIYVKNYIVFYTIIENTMEVVRILYARRNFKHLL